MSNIPSPAASEVQPRDIVEGLGKGLRVIEAFDADHPRLNASEVAALTGITRTAARRHLLSLVHFGYADTDGKHFWLAPRVLRLGQSYLGAARLPRIAQAFSQQISNQCGETVNVSVLDGHEVVYVVRSSPPRWLSVGYQVGVRVPAHVVTPGVVILSTWGEAALERWIEAHDFHAFTALTVTDPTHFRAEVALARAQGYWTTAGQLDSAYQGLSIPLLDRKGECKGAMGMSVSATAYTPAQLVDKLLPMLREGAQAMRALL
jgi:IclR family transcriptional regulator, pca regulon regulatory protein